MESGQWSSLSTRDESKRDSEQDVGNVGRTNTRSLHRSSSNTLSRRFPVQHAVGFEQGLDCFLPVLEMDRWSCAVECRWGICALSESPSISSGRVHSSEWFLAMMLCTVFDRLSSRICLIKPEHFRSSSILLSVNQPVLFQRIRSVVPKPEKPWPANKENFSLICPRYFLRRLVRLKLERLQKPYVQPVWWLPRIKHPSIIVSTTPIKLLISPESSLPRPIDRSRIPVERNDVQNEDEEKDPITCMLGFFFVNKEMCRWHECCFTSTRAHCLSLSRSLSVCVSL